MGDTGSTAQAQDATRRTIDLGVRLVLIALLAYWCFRIVRPFLMPILWGAILAVALHPLQLRIEGLLGGRRKLAASLLVLAGLAILFLPAIPLSESLVDGIRGVSSHLEQGDEGELRIPPAPESVAGWPVIGPKVYETWNLAASSLQSVLRPFRPQLLAFGRWLVGLARQAAFAFLMTAVSLVIAGVLLFRRDWAVQGARNLGARIDGERGVETVRLAGSAIGTVAKGVVGVAAIQAALAGVGLVAAGVPGAGLWTLLVLVLSVAQLPPILVLGPAILYVVSSDASTTVVVLFTLWSLVAAFSDMVLKPLLLGRNPEIPVLVILVGAIGGLILHGLIGLFVGAVVFSTGYRLFGAWMEGAAPADPADPR